MYMREYVYERADMGGEERVHVTGWMLPIKSGP